MISSRLPIRRGLLGLCLAVVAWAPACRDDAGNPPAGVQCGSTNAAATSAEARAALAGAGDGACVVLTSTSYEGPFVVPAGAKLVAASGSRAAITSVAEGEPALSLGERSEAAFLDVRSSPGVGVAVRAASARLSSVHVTSARTAALAVLCREGCSGGEVTLTDVTLEKSGLGLWVSGAHVLMTGGRSAEHASDSLSAAAGVIAQEGARIELDGVTVENNAGVGVLIDGAATTAVVKSGSISDNAERGLWAQRVAGTSAAPAVRIEGTTFERNRIVGLGGLEARGIIVVGGRVADTVSAPVVTDLATTEQVGDGVGLFGGTGDVRLENLTLEANARAAGIIDAGNAGIIVVGGKVTAGPSGLKFVVQDTSATVEVPAGSRSDAPARLGISAPRLALPAVL
jgi:hypothetical protein